MNFGWGESRQDSALREAQRKRRKTVDHKYLCMQLTQTESSIAKFCLTVLISIAVLATAVTGYVNYHKRQDLIEEQQAWEKSRTELSVPLPPPPQAAAVSVNGDGVSIVIPEDTSWQTILQIIVLVLALYGGIRVINRFTVATEQG